MSTLLQVVPWLVCFFYAFSFVNYFAYFKKKEQQIANRTRTWLISGVGVHTLYIVLLSIYTGHLPVGSTFLVLTTCAWFFVLVYLALELSLGEMTMGVFFLPVILVLQVISNLFINLERPLAPVLNEIFFEVHVALMICAYSAFTISFITSVMYILLSREMQSKELGIFFERLPSLEFFDKLSNQAVNIGLGLVSVGIVLGVYMGLNVWEGKWVLDPKLVAVVISWAIYAFHVLTRTTIGWQGRRAAIVSVVGFNWLLFSFLIVTTFFSKVHNFQ